MHFRKRTLFGFLIVTLTLSSCLQNIVFEKSISLDGPWGYNDLLSYSFSVDDTTSLYSLWLDVSHSTTFAFQNMYIKIYTSFPEGTEKSDIVSLELANKNGLWNGRCRGENCLIHIPLQDKTYFQIPGNYGIRLEQFMRQDDLPGIHALKLRLIKEAS